ncbi:MAG: hypothetical protein LBR38_02000 [Synergistaceae bacterium]|jgi:hypothetical protein|nr:hypothetical protein [Synergistaceae bacterium]
MRFMRTLCLGILVCFVCVLVGIGVVGIGIGFTLFVALCCCWAGLEALLAAFWPSKYDNDSAGTSRIEIRYYTVSDDGEKTETTVIESDGPSDSPRVKKSRESS